MHMQTVVLLIKAIVFYPVVVVVASAPHWLRKWQVWKLLASCYLQVTVAGICKYLCELN